MSIQDTGLIVTLKSPQIRIAQFCLTIGTMGAAHLENCIGDNTPTATSLSNSFPTFSLNINGTGLGLKNLGEDSLSCQH